MAELIVYVKRTSTVTPKLGTKEAPYTTLAEALAVTNASPLTDNYIYIAGKQFNAGNGLSETINANVTASVTIDQWYEEEQWCLTGSLGPLSEVSSNMVASQSGVPDVFTANIAARYGTSLDAASGRGIMMVGYKYYDESRRHWTRARQGSIRRGTNLLTVIRNVLAVGAAVRDGAGNLTITLVGHGYRTSDWITLGGFTGADAVFNITGQIAGTTSSTFTIALAGGSLTSTSAGYVDIRESVFFLVTAASAIVINGDSFIAGDLVVRKHGLGSTGPDLRDVDIVWGGGAGDYNGITATGTGVVVRLRRGWIDRICPRATADGNAALAAGNAQMICEDMEADDCGDHIFYTGSNGTNTNGQWIRGRLGHLAKHVGDSCRVAYTGNGDISGQYDIDYVCNHGITLSADWDTLGIGTVLRADGGATYSNGMWGSTQHSNAPGFARLAIGGMITRRATFYTNPLSFERPNNIEGFQAGTVNEAMFARECERASDREDPTTYAAQWYDCVQYDGVFFKPINSGSSNTFVRCKHFLTGGDRVVQTLFNQSDGVVGHPSAVQNAEVLTVDDIILANGVITSNTSIFVRNTRSNASRNAVWRNQGTVFIHTGDSPTQIVRFLDTGTVTALTAANKLAGTVTAANLSDWENNISCQMAFDNCVFKVASLVNTLHTLFGNSQGPTGASCQDLNMLSDIRDCTIEGFVSGRLAFSSEVPMIDQTADWDNPSWPITSTNRSGSTVTVVQPRHGLKVGDTGYISGCSVSDFNGAATVASVTDINTWTFSKAGTAGSGGGTPIWNGHYVWGSGCRVASTGIGTMVWAISAMTRDGNGAMTITAAGHTCAVGDMVSVDWATTPVDMNGPARVTAVDGNTITVSKQGAAGTYTGSPRLTKLSISVPSTAFVRAKTPTIIDRVLVMA